MIFHENRLLADVSHEISFLISFENKERCRKMSPASVVIGDLRVNCNSRSTSWELYSRCNFNKLQ